MSRDSRSRSVSGGSGPVGERLVAEFKLSGSEEVGRKALTGCELHGIAA